ncbi:MAG: tRNA epoxyqueuosine(34) reductase QueG [Acidobacteriota bacterium]
MSGTRPSAAPQPHGGGEVPPPVETARLLKSWAVEAGFTRAGAARLEPSAHGAALRRWIARGDHAAMDWIARRLALREDPRRLLPSARSALVVALQYHPLTPRPADDGTPSDGLGSDRVPRNDLWPRVARYARGRDYHDVMGRRLKALARRIEATWPGVATRPYVDTGPVLERELAARAGIGVFGKNTMLLHRRWGSYFLLGELLLTLDLAPDAPMTDACGRCVRCLEACPTDALRAPYRLDSRRCISYWTIEHRGDLPSAIRPQLGDWVFGCDLCQEACPHNHRVEAGDDPALALPPERAALDLVALLRLSRDDYVTRLRKSPMKRAKREGLQRNAAVAMGNRGDARYVPALIATLDDGAPVVRRHAAWALGQIATPAACAAMRRVRAALAVGDATADDVALRAEIDAALAACGADAGG